MDKTISKLLQITFFSGDENSSKRLQLEAEWNNFKYELSDWSKDHQAIPSPSTTSTEWTLQRFLRHRESYRRSYPLMLQVAEISLSMPVSNAGPERGASALKRLKTHPRNSPKKEMLQSLLHLSINGPPVKESEAVIIKAVALWKEKKHRRKLPRSSRLQQNERAIPNAQEEQEVEEGEGGAVVTQGEEIQEEEIQELPSSNQGELNCLAPSTLGQEEEVDQLAKELDLTFSSEDSAFESDMDYLLFNFEYCYQSMYTRSPKGKVKRTT